MSITNAERIAAMIAASPQNVLIHTVPNSELWIVMYQNKKSHPNWRCVLCNPMLTTWRLVTENITPNEHWMLFKKLTEAHVNNRFNHYLESLKKTTINFKTNYYANHKLRRNRY